MCMNNNYFKVFSLPFFASPTCRFHFLRKGSAKQIRSQENIDRNMSFLNYTAGWLMRQHFS